MTDAEREAFENTASEVRATQAVLNAFLLTLIRSGNSAVVNEAFIIAGDTFTALSLNPATSKEATSVLRIIDHMRKITMGGDTAAR
jgi:hypothetical protein